MKTYTLLTLFLMGAFVLHGQTVVTLNLPNPCSVSSINETQTAKNALDFNVMPNPTGGIFTLDIFSSEPLGLLTIQLISMQGNITFKEQVFSEQKHSIRTYNIGHLPEGVYTLSVISKKERKTKKIIFSKQ